MSSKDHKLELLQQRIASLSPEKKAILEKKLKQRKSKTNQPKISPRRDKNEFTLSYAQERLWFLHQLDPNNPTYNIAIAWNFQGKLSIEILKKSFQEIIDRHETLRTNFTKTATGKPAIKINSNPELFLPIIDLENSPNKEEQSKLVIQEIAKKPFDLETEIPIRLNVIKLSLTESIVIIVLHHIVADGWSRGILLKEFSLLYKAFSNKLPSPLEKTAIQYTDFALWQKEWLLGKEQQIQLDYWQNQLDNLTVLDLPTDFPRPPVQTYNGTIESFTLTTEITDKLKYLSRQQGVTLFMTLLTAFKILLHRYSGQNDIAVGSPIANRNFPEIANTIGFFVNTLVLRSDLSENPIFIDLLTQVKSVANNAYKNQDLPFAKLVEELHPDRNLSQNPLFQVMLQFQNQAYQLQNSLSPELAIPDLNFTQDWIDTGAIKFDLTWHLIEREDTILTVIEYSTDLFKTDTIQRMFGHFQTLIQNIISNPQARLSELSILTPQETKQVLIDWNQTKTELPDVPCFHQLFEAQVELTPNNIAVETFTEESITYTELNDQANRLAHYLIDIGVSLERKIGICLDRSIDLIIGLLAIQKAGGVYIPLDPNYPQTRLDYIVEDAQINILLTETKYRQNFADNLTVIEVNINKDECPSPLQSAPLHPDNLAYIIYTSGSTGKPKGTMITHRGLVNYLTWAISEYPLTNGCGVPVQSSISFDATITSLYTALLVGQKIVLFPEQKELETLKNVLNSNSEYSLIKLTPAHLNAAARLSDSHRLLRRKTTEPAVTVGQETVKPAQAFIIGGEALTKSAIELWQKRTPQTKFINEYGPTETVVGCCVYEIPRENNFYNQVPIGNPIANTQLYILDEYLQPVPIGIPGELYIGGYGIARGYLQQPGLTAERFIPNPFVETYHGTSLRESSRLYKTGDKARYLPNGTIEYLGRLDNQVKIRGFRIELKEVETVLTKHDSVQSALVVARDDRLIAYIISCGDINTLRSYLREKLPSYMIPSNFVTLDTFPLTPNGKIDKRALPIPNLIDRDKPIIHPRTPKETKLAEIWQEVLNRKEISMEDNFFELGGDSILSIQIIARAKQVGLTLTPKQLFQYQTIAGLAAVAEENQPIQAQQGLVTGEIPLTPIQHWFFEQNLINFSHYNQAVLLEVTPNLNGEWLQSALHHLVSHHDALRSRFTKNDSGWVQFNLETLTEISFTTVDLTTVDRNSQNLSITETANQLQSGLDITTGKMVAAALFRLGNNKSDRLLLIIHHLVVDGVSWRILLEDLVRAYRQLETGKSLQLPPKTTSYQYWGEKLQQYAQEAKVKQELDYWLNISNKSIAPIPLDISSPRENNTVISTKQISVALDQENTRLLLTEVPQAYNTRIDDVLLTALMQSFYLWTNSKTLLLDLESYGRGEIWDALDISRTVGWFTAIYPVKLEIKSFTQPGETLKTIKEQLRQITNQGFNYGVLKYLTSESNQQLPTAEIAFNYLGQIQLQSTDMIIGLAQESTGNSRHPQAIRRYLLEINGAIDNNQLKLNWVYSQNFHRKETITKLADNWLKSLVNIIKHCTSTEEANYTPSDFSAAKVNQNQLDKLMKQIKKKKT